MRLSASRTTAFRSTGRSVRAGALLGEAQQVLGDLLAALGALLDLPQRLEVVSRLGAVQHHQLHVAEDAGQRVVDLVRHAGAQLAHRRQLLRLEQLDLGGPQLGGGLVHLDAQIVVPAQQPGARRLQLGAHPVEGVGQLAELVVPVRPSTRRSQLAAAEGLRAADHLPTAGG